MKTTDIADALSELATQAEQLKQRTTRTLSDSSLRGRRRYECFAAARLLDLAQNVLKEITGSVRLLELAVGDEQVLMAQRRHAESRVLWVRGLLERAESTLQ